MFRIYEKVINYTSTSSNFPPYLPVKATKNIEILPIKSCTILNNSDDTWLIFYSPALSPIAWCFSLKTVVQQFGIERIDGANIPPSQ